MNTQQQGYYRYPTLYKNHVVFISEDELWSLNLNSPSPCANRLSTGLGIVSNPSFSKDGKNIAFISSQEGGSDVYTMPFCGGESRRLTYFGDVGSHILGWTSNNKIIIATSSFQPFRALNNIFILNPQNGSLTRLKVGPANDIVFSPDGSKTCIIQRHGVRNYSYWKRYRGGTSGEFWIDYLGTGDFKPFIKLEGNLSSPIWIGERIYFLSDHEGIGSIYSSTIKGKDIKKEVFHKDFYLRHPTTDGESIVYNAGADLYFFNPKKRENKKINFSYPSSRPQRARKLVGIKSYLENCILHPNGHHLALSARGKAIILPNWEGSPIYLGNRTEDIRYRQIIWLNDGERLAVVRIAEEEDVIEIYRVGKSKPDFIINHKFIGHVLILKESPCASIIALSNHRGQLICLYLSEIPKVKIFDKSYFESIQGFNWSSDGQWITYSTSLSL